MRNAKYIEVKAAVRYWEDADINGVEDDYGTLIPFRSGDDWCPVINLDTGIIEDWPSGTVARIHYKVCDAGEYWLLDESKTRIAKWNGCYVPNKFLCHGDNGFGDYIIMDIDRTGVITGYSQPEINHDQWKTQEQNENE